MIRAFPTRQESQTELQWTAEQTDFPQNEQWNAKNNRDFQWLHDPWSYGNDFFRLIAVIRPSHLPLSTFTAKKKN
ncbi:hypothetical protein TNIN_138901 [Trichonephila inaurata madagascariensis]|uniref:Uncharacterized protein n=1 Tax=Trichonephila inaurata madagascariensis TaxID=2747483 RepID=A0A8X7BZS9_9ARAC|nr:hypothetical protein TNIN_138901 [Trichonephila inaurata madagascariensis]